ncbi:MAG: hypothetical protein VYA69_11985 [Gemmatimonadota bacterium]|nr:hypothetical protein [Gemmatimonadota bacterium]
MQEPPSNCLHPAGDQLTCGRPYDHDTQNTVGLLAFIGAWSSFLWTPVVMNSPKKQAIQVGIADFTTIYGLYRVRKRLTSWLPSP